MKTILTCILLLSISTFGFTQTLKADGLEAEIESIEKNVSKALGVKFIKYSGIVKVKSTDAVTTKYEFFYSKNNLFTLSYIDGEGERIGPKLYYNKKSKSFKYYDESDTEFDIKAISGKSKEHIILSGTIILMRMAKSL